MQHRRSLTVGLVGTTGPQAHTARRCLRLAIHPDPRHVVHRLRQRHLPL